MEYNFDKLDDIPFKVKSNPLTEKEAEELAMFFDEVRLEKAK